MAHGATTTATGLRVESCRSDLGVADLVEVPVAPLADGEVLARVERVALTTNNMSYAVYGDALGYWSLFPAGQDGYGCIPAWGFAEVVASRCAEVPVGRRVFGYFPIATHLTLRPSAVTSRSFVDGAAHRGEVPRVYNLYELWSDRPDSRLDSLVMLFRALFITSYTAVDHLRGRDLLGAEQLVISSASSKTAYGVAHCLADVPGRKVALTSPRNVAFVESLGCYDEVLTYDDLESLDAGRSTVYVDLAADAALRRRLHEHLGERLLHDCLLGSTQGTEIPGPDPDLPGPDPEFFFAATQLDAYKAAGESRAFMERYERDERAFLERVLDPERPWMRLVEHAGLDDAPTVIAELHHGSTDPAVGHVFDLTDA